VRLGVFTETGIRVRGLQPEESIIVLATGVNNICGKFDDPLEACRAVDSDSYKLWLQFELRTHDINMICIFGDSI